MKEFKIIEKNFRSLTNSSKASQNLIDDVAKISLKKDQELVISKDIFVEDVHFLKKDGGFKIASKLLRTNLSDIASSGATPIYYMLGFSKNEQTDQKFINDFTRGLKSIQDEFDLSLIGGDTVFSQKLFFSITIFAIAKKGKILSRNFAKNGDLIYVSGDIGDAFLGLNNQNNKYLSNRHFFPEPRISLGKNLLENKLSKCAIDISDGLLSDLNHICKASNLSAEIFLKNIPLSKEAKKIMQKNKKISLKDLISGGDDYELIFCINQKDQKKIVELSKKLSIKLTNIGKMIKNSKKPEITIFNQDNKKIKIEKFGYEH